LRRDFPAEWVAALRLIEMAMHGQLGAAHSGMVTERRDTGMPIKSGAG
jgi:hypothetical protein